jgi:hypothetical protein
VSPGPSVRSALAGLGFVLAAACSACSGAAAIPSASLPSGAADPATVLEAARNRLAGESASYRFRITAEVHLGGATFEYEMEGAVAGSDGELSIVASEGSVDTGLDVVAAGGRGYVRQDEGPWLEVDLARIRSMTEYWLALTRAESMTFDGLEGSADDLRYRFRNSQSIPQYPQDNSVVHYGEIAVTSCILLVGGDGIPVSMEAQETGLATYRGTDVRVTGTMTYTFSDVGSDIEITAPV